jgi:hypothetical protein
MGRYRLSRGKTPAEPFHEFRNGWKAYDAALRYLCDRRPHPGESLPDFVARLAMAAEVLGQVRFGVVREVALYVRPGEDPGAVIARWRMRERARGDRLVAEFEARKVRPAAPAA